MNSCPPELHSYILGLACTDNGYTARSLSLVSRYYSQIALPYLYQSVVLYSPAQVYTLSKNFQNIPSHLRRIQHLFISDDACGERGLVNVIDFILTTAAPTLETLAFVSLSPLTSAPLIARLFRTRFPHLHELTVLGHYPFPSSPSNFPSLERLHLLGNRNPHGLFSLGGLGCAMPKLTHLRVSGINLAVSFSGELQQAFISSTENDDEECTFPVKLPPKLEQLVVQCGPVSSSYARARLNDEAMIKKLHDLEKQHNRENHQPRLVMFPRSSEEVSAREIQAQWEDRLRGKEGCWPKH